MKYLLCDMNYRYESDSERNIYTVARPLQIFETLEQAKYALELFHPFYTLMVVREDQLDDEH